MIITPTSNIAVEYMRNMPSTTNSDAQQSARPPKQRRTELEKLVVRGRPRWAVKEFVVSSRLRSREEERKGKPRSNTAVIGLRNGSSRKSPWKSGAISKEKGRGKERSPVKTHANSLQIKVEAIESKPKARKVAEIVEEAADSTIKRRRIENTPAQVEPDPVVPPQAAELIAVEKEVSNEAASSIVEASKGDDVCAVLVPEGEENTNVSINASEDNSSTMSMKSEVEEGAQQSSPEVDVHAALALEREKSKVAEARIIELEKMFKILSERMTFLEERVHAVEGGTHAHNAMKPVVIHHCVYDSSNEWEREEEMAHTLLSLKVAP